MLIEVQTSKQGEEQVFRDIELKDLGSRMGDFISDIIRNSNKPDTVSIWVSDGEELDNVYERTTSTEIEASDLLEMLNQVKKDNE